MQYNLATLNQFRVSQPGQSEIVRQPLYDFQLYPTAGQAQLSFFQNPVGQGITSAVGAPVGTAKSFADTNMRASGQLSAGMQVIMESIEVIFEPGSSAAASTFVNANPAQFAAANAATVLAALSDVNTFRVSGWLELFILSKVYLWNAPMGAFPPMTRLEIDAAIATTSATAGEVTAATAHAAGRPFFVDPQITLDSNTNFSVSLNWPGLVPTPSGFNARVGVVLDGVVYRTAQ